MKKIYQTEFLKNNNSGLADRFSRNDRSLMEAIRLSEWLLVWENAKRGVRIVNLATALGWDSV